MSTIPMRWGYAPYSGVTNNQTESLNYMYILKQLQEWHEASMDCMVLALHSVGTAQPAVLHVVHAEKIACELNIGNYHLHA